MPRDLSKLRATLGHPDATPIAKLIGFQLVELREGSALFSMEAGPQHHNPMGTLHGGVLCDIADAAMGFAYVSTLEEGDSFTTLELKVNYLRPVFSGKLTAESRMVKSGRSVGMVECDVKDREGRLVARASSTCMTLRGDQAKGR
jgi:uncharacterized protein (TIGR00369 family)